MILVPNCLFLGMFPLSVHVDKNMVLMLFKWVNVRKSPDGIGGPLLLTCDTACRHVFAIFSLCHLSSRKFLIFGRSPLLCLCLKLRFISHKDHRPLALTFLIMKSFERVALNYIFFYHSLKIRPIPICLWRQTGAFMMPQAHFLRWFYHT